eukprot:COSAG05_NODE_821_length_7122_cov_142.066781_3_plen_600_part_00
MSAQRCVTGPFPLQRTLWRPPSHSDLRSGQVFGNGGEALDDDDLRLALGVEEQEASAADADTAFASAADAIAARLAKLGWSPVPEAASRGQNSDGPYLDEMPSDVLVRIMQCLGLDATERVCFASASPKIREAVRRAGPVAWRELEFVHNPVAAAKLSTQGLKTLATISDGELRRLDVTGCFNLSRASIINVAKSNKHLEEVLVRFETSWAPDHTSAFAKSLMDLCPRLKCLRCDITAPTPTPELLQLLDPAAAGIVKARMVELVPPNRSEQDEAERLVNQAPPLLTVEQIDALTETLRLPGCSVDRLDLSFNRLGAEHCLGLTTGLPRKRAAARSAADEEPQYLLDALNVRFNGFADAGLAHICTALYGGDPIVGVGLRVPADMLELDISFNGISEDGCAGLAAALCGACCHLETLIMCCNAAGPDGTEALAEALRNNESLTVLDLSMNDIGDEGAWELADALEENTCLRSLKLDGNGITGAGIEFFPSTLRKNSQLEALSFAMNKLGDDGAKAIATMLSFVDPAVSEAAANSEDQEDHNCLLQRLNLDGNGISDVGADALATALSGNSSLKMLSIRGNFLSEIQIAWSVTPNNSTTR